MVKSRLRLESLTVVLVVTITYFPLHVPHSIRNGTGLVGFHCLPICTCIYKHGIKGSPLMVLTNLITRTWILQVFTSVISVFAFFGSPDKSQLERNSVFFFSGVWPPKHKTSLWGAELHFGTWSGFLKSTVDWWWVGVELSSDICDDNGETFGLECSGTKSGNDKPKKTKGQKVSDLIPRRTRKWRWWWRWWWW